MNFKMVLSIILAVLALIFIIQNAAVVEIHFLLWTVSMSRLIWMFLLLAFGLVIGWLLHSLYNARKK